MEDKKKINNLLYIIGGLALICIIGLMSEKSDKQKDLKENKPKASYEVSKDKKNKKETKKEDKKDSDEKTIDEKADAMNNKEVITADNNDLFKKIINAEDPEIEDLKEFAKKYELRTVEFDGNIRAFFYSNDKETRFDMLFNTLDYEEDSSTGPNFKFEYASADEIGLEYGEEIPYKVGDNVKIKAQVAEYDEEHGLFKLYPLKLTKRK